MSRRLLSFPSFWLVALALILSLSCQLISDSLPSAPAEDDIVAAPVDAASAGEPAKAGVETDSSDEQPAPETGAADPAEIPTVAPCRS